MKERTPRPGNAGHDPICPCSDIELAWEGATCYCSVIRILRGMDGIDHYVIDPEVALRDLEAAKLRKL